MRSTLAATSFRLGLLALTACSRSPLEGPELSQPEGEAGGSLAGTGPGAGGSLTGGAVLGGGAGQGAGGALVGGSAVVGGSGGAAVPVSSVSPNTGGFPSTDRGTGAGGSMVSGGRGGNAGGAVVAGSMASGGRGGSVGGMAVGGSMVSSGRGGSAGGMAVGGSMVSAGRGGNVGGMVVGGSMVSGGRSGNVGGAAVAGSNGGRGGSGGTLSSSGTSTCPVLASNEELIDDLNDGDRYIPKVNGRVGAWSVGNDKTPGGTMVPDPATTFTPTDTGDPCRKYAVFVKGTGFTDGGAEFFVGLGAPYDASKYTGISFWAKSDNGGQLMRALFPDKDTDPEAGICKMNGSGSTQCYDHYGKRFTITPGWNKYTIAFKELSQDGWGHQGTAFDPASLFEIYFQIPPNATFALWLDDLAFTR